MSQINETTIKTPGVYINEIPSFPPSVAQVATAIPAFIGYTQTATKKGRDVTNQAVRISSLVQYKQYFGEGFPGLVAAVVLRNDNSVDSVAIEPRYQLYNAVRMFYANGGGDCYIISVGPYEDDGSADIVDFIDDGEERCLEVLRREDEPTLIVIPDAVLLGNADFNTLMQRSLNLCGEMQDRFTIMDVLNGDQDRSFDNTDVITVFRNGMGTSNLNYGAAYYPWLRSSLPYDFSYHNVNLEKPAGTPIAVADVVVNNPSVTQIDRAIDDLDLVNDFINTPGFAVPFNVAPLNGPITTAFGFIANDAGEVTNKITYIKNILTAFLAFDGSFTDEDAANVIEGLTTQDIFTNYTQTGTPTSFSATDRLVRELLLLDMSYPVAPGPPLGIAVAGDFPDHNTTGLVADATIYDPAPADALAAAANIRNRLQQLYDNVVNYVLSFRSEVERRITSLDLQIIASSGIYANITNAIRSQGVVVVPSGAIAGVYASVDATRGVWKAPANVSLVNVIEPMVTISDRMQEDLNVDTNAGKSVNAIRSFIGKGVLVWGSRTLDAFSNDWRYIPVRRFYIMVEESVKKASMLFVFEPNDANTWVKIRAMIENYLTVLWRQGALAGPKPEQAFYVKVGLGQTMTFQDILEGRLIVEIGMAPVRPAEFIILRFSQIQQQA